MKSGKRFVCGWDASRWPCYTAGADGDPNPKDEVGKSKVPLRFIPPVALIAEAGAMECGAAKYGPFNWRLAPVYMTVYLEAALRHLGKIADGEDIDPESGCEHIGHVRACMGIILDARACGTLIDDRPPPGKFAEAEAAFLAGRVAKPDFESMEPRSGNARQILEDAAWMSLAFGGLPRNAAHAPRCACAQCLRSAPEPAPIVPESADPTPRRNARRKI